jgi:hypothetical protein
MNRRTDSNPDRHILREGTDVLVFNWLPTEGYAQGGKFWVRRRRDQELEGARNTRLLDRFGPHGA